MAKSRVAAPAPGAKSEAEYLTTAEVARLLRLNQKKVYALLQEGRLPAARISGKWLFPRTLIQRWIAENTVYPAAGMMGAILDRLLVIQGSDDWLLGRAIEAVRERQGAAVATALVGSVAGLRALAEGGAHAAGFHLTDDEAARIVPGGETWYVTDLAEREQGLMFDRGRPEPIREPADLVRNWIRLADRQRDSGTHRLTRRLVSAAGVNPDDLRTVGPFSSHIEAGLAVRAGLADAAVGIRVAAEMCGLAFVPVHREMFRLAVPGRYYGHARIAGFLQALLAEFESARKRSMPGYSFDGLGRTKPLRSSG